MEDALTNDVERENDYTQQGPTCHQNINILSIFHVPSEHMEKNLGHSCNQ